MKSFVVRRITRPLSALTLALVVGSPSGLTAQETIASDRPGIGSGSSTVRLGVVQLETGLSVAVTDLDRTYSIGEALVRIGTALTEVQVFVNSYLVRRGDAATPQLDDDGLQDFALGFKFPLSIDEASPFAASLQGILTAPTGSSAFGGEEWVPALNGLVDVALGEHATVGLNAGYRIEPGGRSDAVTASVTPAVALGERLGAYAGWAGEFIGGRDIHFAEGGFTWLANANVQLDINAGWNVDRDDWFVGVGFATRWGA